MFSFQCIDQHKIVFDISTVAQQQHRSNRLTHGKSVQFDRFGCRRKLTTCCCANTRTKKKRWFHHGLKRFLRFWCFWLFDYTNKQYRNDEASTNYTLMASFVRILWHKQSACVVCLAIISPTTQTCVVIVASHDFPRFSMTLSLEFYHFCDAFRSV